MRRDQILPAKRYEPAYVPSLVPHTIGLQLFQGQKQGVAVGAEVSLLPNAEGTNKLRVTTTCEPRP